jgi:hypothetical protein
MGYSRIWDAGLTRDFVGAQIYSTNFSAQKSSGAFSDP